MLQGKDDWNHAFLEQLRDLPSLHVSFAMPVERAERVSDQRRLVEQLVYPKLILNADESRLYGVAKGAPEGSTGVELRRLCETRSGSWFLRRDKQMPNRLPELLADRSRTNMKLGAYSSDLPAYESLVCYFNRVPNHSKDWLQMSDGVTIAASRFKGLTPSAATGVRSHLSSHGEGMAVEVSLTDAGSYFRLHCSPGSVDQLWGIIVDAAYRIEAAGAPSKRPMT